MKKPLLPTLDADQMNNKLFRKVKSLIRGGVKMDKKIKTGFMADEKKIYNSTLKK